MSILAARALSLAAACAAETCPEPALSAAKGRSEGASALPIRNTAAERALCRKYASGADALSASALSSGGDLVLAVADALFRLHGERGLAYDLLAAHPGAMAALDAPTLERFGQGIDSWWTVDHFARHLSGPAWRDARIGDEVIHRWARSPDRWWRRAALVSTVALNVRSKGGEGDVQRTLAVCRLLVADRDDMVAKALSWALRELDVHDPAAVWAFLAEHDAVLPALVKREVRNKLTTGLKNPKRRLR